MTRIALVTLGAQCAIKLRQPYTFIGQKAFVQSAHYAHACQFNQAKAQTKKLRVMLGRVIRGIARAKAHTRYEFGVKVGLVTARKESFVRAAASLPGNPYDGHTLKQCLDQAKRTCGVAAKQVFVDKDYKAHGRTLDACKVLVSGSKRGITPPISKRLKLRSAIEPVIGQMKSDSRLSGNFLKETNGDAVNALLRGSAHNLRKVLNKLRLFLHSDGRRAVWLTPDPAFAANWLLR
jgi:transposase, IS5 family